MRIIGHGIDIVEIERIAAMLDAHGDHFIQRCFTSQEQAYADAGRKRRPERYAVRFACKEAVLKALGTGGRSGIGWCDIEVRRDPMGQPRLALSGRCLEISQSLQIREWHVSLSHTSRTAIASVLGCG